MFIIVYSFHDIVWSDQCQLDCFLSNQQRSMRHLRRGLVDVIDGSYNIGWLLACHSLSNAELILNTTIKIEPSISRAMINLHLLYAYVL